MAKSYDWDMGYGLVVFNPKGLKKYGLNLDPTENAVKWTSKYASITFDQYGCEMPNGGMNTQGLAIELMLLGQTEYPPIDERPALNELQFIQYSLDNFASVAEMIEGVPEIRIAKANAPVHYLACDVAGACAAFEWLEGELVLSSEDNLPVPTLANSTYEDSLEYIAQFEGFGGAKALPEGTSSLDRFVRASALSISLADGDIPDAAFSILDGVSQGSFSKWNIVYDLSEGTIHFRTFDSTTIKTISLDDFEPDCTFGRHVLDIDHPESGHALSAFAPYTDEVNQALIDQSFASIPDIPAFILELLVGYPGSLECVPAGEEPVETHPESEVEVEYSPDLVGSVDVMEILTPEVTAVDDLPGPEPDVGVEKKSGSDGGCSVGPASSAVPWTSLLLLLLFLACTTLGRAPGQPRSRV